MKLYYGAFMVIMGTLIVFTLSNVASLCCSNLSGTLHAFDTMVLSLLVGLGMVMGFIMRGGA